MPVHLISDLHAFHVAVVGSHRENVEEEVRMLEDEGVESNEDGVRMVVGVSKGAEGVERLIPAEGSK